MAPSVDDASSSDIQYNNTYICKQKSPNPHAHAAATNAGAMGNLLTLLLLPRNHPSGRTVGAKNLTLKRVTLARINNALQM
jgi:hypothetical protein